MSKIITRFAPSPTGYLHIGGIRTALINRLIVEKNKTEFPDSKFFLRIEDTDKKRSKDEYFQSIVKSLKWLNIQWDGNIYKQSENINKHIEIANELINPNKKQPMRFTIKISSICHRNKAPGIAPIDIKKNLFHRGFKIIKINSV